MTTIVQFSPASNSIFTFQTTLDGQSYTITCPWSLYGQRYYMTITDLSGNVILNIPLVPSTNDYDISLTAGYFTSEIIFRDSSQQFEIT